MDVTPHGCFHTEDFTTAEGHFLPRKCAFQGCSAHANKMRQDAVTQDNTNTNTHTFTHLSACLSASACLAQTLWSFLY
eukprot:scaffold304071_cov17-Tisochrysis_lutea.AAC.1